MRHLLKIVPLIFISCSLLATKENHFNLDHPELILSALSLPKKIAQLCVVAAASNPEKDTELLKRWKDWQPLYCLETDYIKKLVEEYNVGGILWYGKKVTPEEQRTLTREMQALSPIPLFIAMDAENGLGHWFAADTALIYPRMMTLSATHDPQLAYKMANEIAYQLQAIGTNINWAPVVDVNCNPDNPVIGCRSFGSDPVHVSNMGIAFIQGLQDGTIIACPKHFPGHGDTAIDSHIGLPLIPHDRDRLDKIELFPFVQVIQKAQPKAIMTAHLEVPSLEPEKGKPATLSYAIMTDVLQKQLLFDGLIVTDALGMHGTSKFAEPGELEVLALLAGVDILLCPIDPIKTIDAVEQAVKEGRITEEEIDRKVLKVLRAKQWAFAQQSQAEELQKVLFSDSAKELQKELYSKAITMLKNNDNYDYLTTRIKPTIIALSDNPTELNTEQQIPYLRLPYNIEPAEIATIIKAIKTKHVVISIHNPKWWSYSEHQVPEGISALIARLKELKKLVTVVVFGSPYTANNLKNADAIILGYEDNKWAQQAVLEVLMGRQKATGVCPV